MKTKFLALCLLFTCYCINNIYAVNIRGKILNPENNIVTLMYQDGLLRNNLVRVNCKLSDNADFLFSISCTTTYKCIEMIYGEVRLDLIVDSSYDLYLSFDPKNVAKTIQFSGYGKSIAEFAFDHQQVFGFKSDRVRTVRSFYISDSSEFGQQLDKMYQDELIYLNNKETFLPFDFTQYWKVVLQYEYTNRLQHYSAYHSFIYQREGQLPPVVNGNTDCINVFFYDFYLNVPEYKLCVKSYHASEIDSIDKGDVALLIETINKISSVMPEETCEFYIASIMHKEHYAISHNYRQLFEFFKSKYPASKYLSVLNEYYLTKSSKL